MINNNLNKLVGTPNPTERANQTTAVPGTDPILQGKLEDVFILKSAEYPLEQHECNTFLPPMLPDQFRRLMEDIRKNGLKVPIVLCEGKILDGWQRYQSCRHLKIEPRFQPFIGKQPLLQCWRLNIARRHLEKSQLAVLANEMTSRLLSELAAEKEGRVGDGDKTVTAAQADEAGDPENTEKKRIKRKRERARSVAAEAFNVSEGYIQRAKDLKGAAPDLYEKVGVGTLTLSGAIGQLSRRQQAEGVLGATEKKRPSDQLQIKGWVIKICHILNSTSDEKEAYDAVQPVVAWSVGYEKREQALKEAMAKDEAWMAPLASKFPVPKAA
jgi:hypothetical protein